jgi:hypothetical protein
MKKKNRTSRRDFLKATTISTAGLAVGSSFIKNTKAETRGWTEAKSIHPSIDNLRVVVAHDSTMVNTNCINFSGFSMEKQNNYANTSKIQENMDKMAIALAGDKSTAEPAWKKLFIKPASKSWNEVTVAIKINALGSNHPRVAVIGKICSELINCGVSAENITIFDAGRTATTLYDSFIGNGIPANVNVSNGGSKVNVPTTGTNTVTCTDILAKEVNGAIVYQKDILINIAVCKGHSQSQNGGFTLTLKNHIGTVNINKCPSAEKLVEINQCEAILGNFESGEPRQYLCIVDALWSATYGPGGDPNVDTHRLVMGTHSPIVDYLTVKRIREPILDDPAVSGKLETILTGYGYDINDSEINDLDFIDALTYSSDSVGSEKFVLNNPFLATLTVKSPRFRHNKVQMILPGKNYISSFLILDMKGRVVQDIELRGHGKKNVDISWDGKDINGRYVNSGMYIVKCTAGNTTLRRKLMLIK